MSTTAACETVAQYLTSIVETNRDKSFVHTGENPFAVFDCIVEPSLSLPRFLRRITRGTSDTELLQAVVLVFRLCRRYEVLLTCYNAHRLMLAALVLSVKLQRDVVGVVKHFSQLSSIPERDLVQTHHLFFSLLGGELLVSREEFNALGHHVLRGVSTKQVSPTSKETSTAGPSSA